MSSCSLTAADLATDTLRQDAITRCFGVIGEAARHTSQDLKARHPAIPWPLMVAMRNRLVHDYSQVDYGLVLQTIRDDLPPLVEQIERILADETETWHLGHARRGMHHAAIGLTTPASSMYG